MTAQADILTRAVLLNSQRRPTPEALTAQLLGLEKTAKREKRTYPFVSLLGTWQLTFITGTKKAQKQAGKVLGQGRYLPQWVTVAIAYDALTEQDPTTNWQRGSVTNNVHLGPLHLSLTGPVKFQTQKRLLAFDFTQITISLGGLRLYRGQIRGGETARQDFYATTIGKQAFFSYFYVSPDVIAARGRGGGLALWVKAETS
ncbi:hypothetical protein [Picosynechococcus sp. PCC 73109]|uniref:hypothetical protein n=1 Tax=Picosynechococcus sp. PCC 73109 TaxID=374982 RepID=UPI0007458196|nr:hypothetical protein [Picosynechococcus sp. PCC 73109]AMA09809.1 hypothetical protein AWQ23_11010 [Picosynechococcus sp. PCC 73109]